MGEQTAEQIADELLNYHGNGSITKAAAAMLKEQASKLDVVLAAKVANEHHIGELRSRLRTLAIGIVGARMCHVEEDYAEAYHLLYTAARELSDDPHEPWKAVDALADGAIERRDGQTFVSFAAVESLGRKVDG